MSTNNQVASLTQSDAVNKGIADAQAALAESSAPIFVMDEGSSNEDERDYAMGWNSIWASDANRERFTDFVIDPKGYAGSATGIRTFRERTGAEVSQDLMRLNFRLDQV